jgi:hypothetical protein
MSTEAPENDYRGKSVYEIIEADGWNSIRSPHCMRSYDCYRKGNRRAFIEWDQIDGRTFYSAVEAQPSVDSFNQRHWKRLGVIARDGHHPHVNV